MLADIIVPIPVAINYSYRVPAQLEGTITEGMRVIIPVGKSKLYTGIVKKIHPHTSPSENTKDIISLPDSHPIITQTEISLWEWVAFYYHCSIGEVYKAAIPSYYRDFEDLWVSIDQSVILPKDAEILRNELNSNQEFNLKHASQMLESKVVAKAIIALGGNNIYIDHRSTIFPKQQVYYRNVNHEDLLLAIDNNKRAPARKKVLEYFIDHDSLTRQELKDQIGVGTPILKTLLEASILKTEEKVLDEEENIKSDYSNLPDLSNDQNIAYNDILNGFDSNKVTLLHGVTSSGKTLIYLHLIKKQLEEGKQILYLLPEIALTTQIIDRINEFTGGIAEIYHSKFTGKARLRLYEKVKSGKPVLIIGARSSVFLPFRKLGLIIVDEEHDQSFKQHEPSPRYNARDMAVMLGHKHKANVLLGSATPSSESWLNALGGKYHLVKLYKRYNNFPLPQIELLDTRHARKRKVMDSEFHPDTIKQIKEVLERQGQIIILRNRKGYAPLIRCNDCGWTASCPNCSVHLTYHKKDVKLRCHHCHHTEPMPHECPDCKGTDLGYFGYGTQKVEEDLHFVFPDIKISRFDQDSLHNPKEFRKIIQDFTDQKTQILVGTQMLTKGLDFKNVRLIAVLHADQILNYPDFRAFERGYQMLEQVSGRTGRHSDDAKVIIQTSFPDHGVLQSVYHHNFNNMMTNELRERKALQYPPFVHLVNIHIKSTNQFIIENRSQLLQRDLRREFGVMVGEVMLPVIEKKGKMYERYVQVKVLKNKDQYRYKAYLQKVVNGFANSSAGKGLRIFMNADPV